MNENEGPPSHPPDYFDWSDVPSYIGSPPSSHFHAFGPDEKIQGRLHIKTEIVDGEEVFVDIQRKQRRGRPRGEQKTDTDLIIVEDRR